MAPDTGYIISPWSMRGYESVHGSIIFTIGALALIYGVLAMLPISVKPIWSRIFAVIMGVVTVVVTAAYGGPLKEMGGGMLGWFLALLGGYIVAKAVDMWLPASFNKTARSVIKLAVIIVGAVLLNLLIFGNERTAMPWVWVGIATVIMLGLSITGKHPQLSANRMLMFLTAGGWIAIALSAAAARTHLLELQLQESAGALVGDYKDVQVTSGYFIALMGMLLVIVGGISMWAKRRDIIINEERAERQRVAAEASAAEIQAALEIAQQHQREARAAH